ncbi:MAG: cation:proton antiporter [Patescibacteria group bacterium]|nr:cation:proton antiporter [Patescibacteria group bacterium]MCL5432127.1 cation:proton antiporter [Patescibacteria group bacterium]
MTGIYFLALVVCLAAGLAILVRRAKQPLVVSYLVAGAILSLFGVVNTTFLQSVQLLPDIGLAFLLFLVGMELDLNEFKNLGRSILLAALGQVAVGAILMTLVFGNPVVGIAVSFSSTILVVKLLLEGRDLVSLQGKLAVGVLLTEDMLAVILLMLLGLSGIGVGSVLVVFLKAALLIWLALFAGRRLLPRLFRVAADNSELLFLTAIGWCLLFVSLALFLGISLAIGAFLAGVCLAQSVYRTQVSSRIKPLRDFFVMIFFIDLGAGLSLSALAGAAWLVLALIIYAVVLKPTIFYFIFIVQRFRAHTAFRAAVLMSSISEFSLITVYLAQRSGIIPAALVAPVVLATILSFVFSSLLITHSHVLYGRLRSVLKRAERKNLLSLDFVPAEKTFSDHAILIGCHRSGQIVLARLRKTFGENLLVLDFNPDVIEELKNHYVACVYGDIADVEIQERLNLKEAKLIVSTVRDLEDNLALLDGVEKAQSKAVVIITAADAAEAVTLYQRGAHHVSLPLALEGVSISRLIYDYQDNLSELAKDRERKLGELKREVHRP